MYYFAEQRVVQFSVSYRCSLEYLQNEKDFGFVAHLTAINSFIALLKCISIFKMDENCCIESNINSCYE